MTRTASTFFNRNFYGNPSHLSRLVDALQPNGIAEWNGWRKRNPAVRPDLRGMDLRYLDREENVSRLVLGGIDLRSARLSGANLSGANLWDARLDKADLRNAYLDMAELNYASLQDARLDSSRLVAANLTLAKAQRASFRHAYLSHAVLNGAQLQGADLTGARVVGTSVWNVEIDASTRQRGLVVDAWVDPLEDVADDIGGAVENIIVRTDQLEAAYLLSLVSDRRKFKTVIDAMTARVVLLLGNFGLRRKAILKAMASKLSDYGYSPVIFDFEEPDNRDLVETVSPLAGLSRFVIADLTRPKSTPLEAMLITPQLMVPFASVIHEGERPFAMFRSLQAKYDWVLPTWVYRDKGHLIRRLKTAVINPCERTRLILGRRRRAAGIAP